MFLVLIECLIADGAESGSQRSLSGVEESNNSRMASSNENSSPNQAPEDDIANESAEGWVLNKRETFGILT